MKDAREQVKLWSVPQVHNLTFLRAHFTTYSFKRHAHDYYVIAIVEKGLQKFQYTSGQYTTPPGGIIVLNPGEAHTGEPAADGGFWYRAFYPDVELMRQVASDIADRPQTIPLFSQPVIHDPALYRLLRRFHVRTERGASKLEHETNLLYALAQLMTRHADANLQPRAARPERAEIKRLRAYVEEHYAEDITLDDLARVAGWSPYYMLRVFHQETGLPPHAYLESIRIRRAQELLAGHQSIVETAYATGFSSQSHFTSTFKRILGVTPGHYASAIS